MKEERIRIRLGVKWSGAEESRDFHIHYSRIYVVRCVRAKVKYGTTGRGKAGRSEGKKEGGR